jgi:hypothetical protein
MAATTFKNVSSATTDSVVISAVSDRIIRVFGLSVNCGSTATAVTFNSKGSSSGVAISPDYSLGAYGSIVLPQPANISTRTVWFQTASSESLTVTTGTGSTVGIQVVYDIYAPLETISVVVSPTGPFDSYSVSNVTTTTTYDADSTSLDELANVLGTLINLFKTGTTVTSSFTVTNVTTDQSYDATSTSLDELADVLGSIIASLAATGTSTDVYTPTNVTTDISFDATSTSIDEVANVIGSVIATLQGVGKLL